MKSYIVKKRKRNFIVLTLIIVVIAAVAAGFFLFFPSDDEVATLPTQTSLPTATLEPTAALDLPSPTPYPPGNEWDLSAGELTSWQLRFLLTDLNKFWTVYMAPEGLMDCATALEIVSKSEPATREGILAECAIVQENGVFDTSLPLDKLTLVAAEMDPDSGFIGIQLDTTKEWPSEVRFIADNALKKVVAMNRTKYNLILLYEEGLWRVVSLKTLIEGADF